MNIDPNTGLPKLPEDMFWKIKVEYSYIQISLHQKIKEPWGFGLKKTVEHYIAMELVHVDDPDAEAQLPGLAQSILDKWEAEAETRRLAEIRRAEEEKERQERWARSEGLRDRLQGKYPPKRLGGF